MKTFFFVPKQNTSDDSTRDIFEEYGNAFKKADIPNVDLVSFDRIQFFLSDTIKDIQEESLFMVPSILDSFNAFSYGGVELALKIYFHYASAKNNKFQIIVLGTEEEYAFWEHCRYSSILKCPHVGFIQNNIYSIQNYLLKVEPIDWNIDWDECIERLKRLNVSKPASYKTHHSITNEWSIYRWSKYLSIENIAIQKDIEEFLYFNYLKAIYPESKIDNPKSFLIAEKGKVLLIDDEVGKGWHTFFKSFLSFSHSVTFDSIGSNFKNLSKEDIIAQTEAKIKEFDPDVVLLDLRLHDTDFEDKSPSELTGAKVFEKIKNYNKGIQIVIFSASNKVWNYLPFASDGVILKESPDLSVNENYTQECIKNLRETLMNCLKKSYLRKIYPKIEKLKKLVKQSDYFGDETDVMLGNIDVAFDLLAKSEEANEYKAYSFLQLFLVIEKYVGLESVFEKTDTSVYLYNGSNRYLILKDGEQKENSKDTYYQSVVTFEPPYFIFKRGSYNARFIETFFKVSVLLIFKFGKSSSNELNWPILNKKRNDIAHSGAEVKDKDIECLLDFMFFIFDESNTCWRDIKDAFPVESLEEQIIKLPE